MATPLQAELAFNRKEIDDYKKELKEAEEELKELQTRYGASLPGRWPGTLTRTYEKPGPWCTGKNATRTSNAVRQRRSRFCRQR